MDGLKCKCCGVEKMAGDFYVNSRKCKECTKKAVRENYRKNRNHYVAYERMRFQDPERKKNLVQYQRNRRRNSPEKYLARQKVARAVKSGRILKPDYCSICGRVGKVEAHHTDYSRPLDVLWMCFECHRIYGHGQTVTAEQ